MLYSHCRHCKDAHYLQIACISVILVPMNEWRLPFTVGLHVCCCSPPTFGHHNGAIFHSYATFFSSFSSPFSLLFSPTLLSFRTRNSAVRSGDCISNPVKYSCVRPTAKRFSAHFAAEIAHFPHFCNDEFQFFLYRSSVWMSCMH